MTGEQVSKYEMLLRVDEAGRTLRAAFPAGTPGAQVFDELSAAIAPLASHTASMRSQTRAEAVKKAAAREAVLESLEAITRCARVIAREHPDVGEMFRTGRMSSNRSVLVAGRAFVEAATRMKADFVALGLPDDFVAQLAERVEAFDHAIRAWETAMTARAAARAAVDAVLPAALDLLPRLDVIVVNRFRDDPAALASWERARRIDMPRRARRAREAAPADPAPPVAEVA